MLTIPGNIIPGENLKFGGVSTPSIISVTDVLIPTNIEVGVPVSVSYSVTGTPTTITRTWYRGATPVFTSTTSDSYTPVNEDAGQNLMVMITVSDGVNSASESSNTVQLMPKWGFASVDNWGDTSLFNWG